jgi:hypothetical protein
MSFTFSKVVNHPWLCGKREFQKLAVGVGDGRCLLEFSDAEIGRGGA